MWKTFTKVPYSNKEENVMLKYLVKVLIQNIKDKDDFLSLFLLISVYETLIFGGDYGSPKQSNIILSGRCV